MDDYVEQPGAPLQMPASSAGEQIDTFTTPAADVFETEAEIVVLLDIPGVTADHLDIDLRDSSLTITARRGELGRHGTAILSEYQRCSYYRTFRVPQSVDEARISASLTDGVLRLVLPKAGRVRTRRIRLKAE
ncbi:MAG: Hsp20/alpha crystallin family protein [Desulfomonile sp.]|nr:Hsp20/alpha crystallin family protein [Desulfomonile sp.]